MGLTSTPVGLTSTASTRDERALERCSSARECIERGDYEGACGELGELWRGVGRRPKVDGLEAEATAEVLLTGGVLTGWLGAARQIEGAQESAKDLFSESQRLFEALRDMEKAAEAQTELGFCYWRAAAYDEARVQFHDALQKLNNCNGIQRVITTLRIATVETSARRYADALRILLGIAPAIEGLKPISSAEHSLKGRFHNTLSVVLERLGVGDERAEYLDRALIEREAAIYHFEEAGNHLFMAYALNNIANIHTAVGRYDEAHRNLTRARRIFVDCKAAGCVAQVDETRASTYIAQGKYPEAERVARQSVAVLEKGDEKGLLAGALIAQGVALARLGRVEQALSVLRRAVMVAEDAGDRATAGRACLSLIEELRGLMSAAELRVTYLHADGLLSQTQHHELLVRLRACARAAFERAEEGKQGDGLLLTSGTPCHLKDEVLGYEGRLILRAYELTGRRVRRAASLLGMKHQTLSLILKERHRGLLPEEIKPKPKTRSYTTARPKSRKSKPRRKTTHAGAVGGRQ